MILQMLTSLRPTRTTYNNGPLHILDMHQSPLNAELQMLHACTVACDTVAWIDGSNLPNSTREINSRANMAYLAAIGIFCCAAASAVFGSVTLSSPFSKIAAIFVRLTLSGSPKLRWKAP